MPPRPPPCVPVPVPGVTAPAPRIGPQPITKFLPPSQRQNDTLTTVGNVAGNIFSNTPLGHLYNFLTGGPVTGGILSMIPAPRVSAPAPSAPAAPSQPVGASFLEAQGQNTSGMTDGQVADALKKSMGMY